MVLDPGSPPQRANHGMDRDASEYARLRIGYVPYDRSLERAGDRRRFCAYARRRGIDLKIADPHSAYDIVVVSEGGDLSVWKDYRGSAKVVYDSVNAYLAMPPSPTGMLRGLAKFMDGQYRRPVFDYAAAVRDMCQRADAIVCNTVEQELRLRSYSDNTHLILDFQSDDIRATKTEYAAGTTFNFVWEGFPENLAFFSEIAEPLHDLARHRRFAIHAITNLQFGHLGGRLLKHDTAALARRLDLSIFLYEWNSQLISSIAASCDLALIPVPLDDPLNSGKPENKLLFFWRIGVPTVVSAIPAYERAMEQSNVRMACRTKEQWRAMLEHYMQDETARRSRAVLGQRYAELNFGEERLIRQWDGVLRSVLR